MSFLPPPPLFIPPNNQPIPGPDSPSGMKRSGHAGSSRSRYVTVPWSNASPAMKDEPSTLTTETPPFVAASMAPSYHESPFHPIGEAEPPASSYTAPFQTEPSFQHPSVAQAPYSGWDVSTSSEIPDAQHAAPPMTDQNIYTSDDMPSTTDFASHQASYDPFNSYPPPAHDEVIESAMDHVESNINNDDDDAFSMPTGAHEAPFAPSYLSHAPSSAITTTMPSASAAPLSAQQFIEQLQLSQAISHFTSDSLLPMHAVPRLIQWIEHDTQFQFSAASKMELDGLVAETSSQQLLCDLPTVQALVEQLYVSTLDETLVAPPPSSYHEPYMEQPISPSPDSPTEHTESHTETTPLSYPDDAYANWYSQDQPTDASLVQGENTEEGHAYAFPSHPPYSEHPNPLYDSSLKGEYDDTRQHNDMHMNHHHSHDDPYEQQQQLYSQNDEMTWHQNANQQPLDPSEPADEPYQNTNTAYDWYAQAPPTEITTEHASLLNDDDIPLSNHYSSHPSNPLSLSSSLSSSRSSLSESSVTLKRPRPPTLAKQSPVDTRVFPSYEHRPTASPSQDASILSNEWGHMTVLPAVTFSPQSDNEEGLEESESYHGNQETASADRRVSLTGDHGYPLAAAAAPSLISYERTVNHEEEKKKNSVPVESGYPSLYEDSSVFSKKTAMNAFPTTPYERPTLSSSMVMSPTEKKLEAMIEALTLQVSELQSRVIEEEEEEEEEESSESFEEDPPNTAYVSEELLRSMEAKHAQLKRELTEELGQMRVQLSQLQPWGDAPPSPSRSIDWPPSLVLPAHSVLDNGPVATGTPLTPRGASTSLASELSRTLDVPSEAFFSTPISAGRGAGGSMLQVTADRMMLEEKEREMEAARHRERLLREEIDLLREQRQFHTVSTSVSDQSTAALEKSFMEETAKLTAEMKELGDEVKALKEREGKEEKETLAQGDVSCQEERCHGDAPTKNGSGKVVTTSLVTVWMVLVVVLWQMHMTELDHYVVPF